MDRTIESKTEGKIFYRHKTSITLFSRFLHSAFFLTKLGAHLALTDIHSNDPSELTHTMALLDYSIVHTDLIVFFLPFKSTTALLLL